MTSIVLRTVMPCFLRVRKLSALLMARSASRKLKTVRLVRRCTGPVVVGVLAKPLEDFGEDKVADRDRLGGEELVKAIGLWGGLSVKVVNPDAGINNNHGLTIVPYPFSCDQGRRPRRVYPVAPGGSLGFSFGSAGSEPVRQLLVVP